MRSLGLMFAVALLVASTTLASAEPFCHPRINGCIDATADTSGILVMSENGNDRTVTFVRAGPDGGLVFQGVFTPVAGETVFVFGGPGGAGAQGGASTTFVGAGTTFLMFNGHGVACVWSPALFRCVSA
ncbi:MAG TPA: hypothetical protein VM370_04425 [Candidatus Thermoplasmatota archaeon]|nr:hypothetical protein [Candidatus Thermoplasmatota archaeon]